MPSIVQEGMSPIAQSFGSTVGLILLAMSALAVLEVTMPLHARNGSHAAHYKPNLALTFITLFTSAFLNAVVVATLLWLRARGWGLLNVLELTPALSVALVVLALDFATYGAHVAMHHVPRLWRFHRVHHSDPALDVTTTLRQHPGEGMVRFVVLWAVTAALGASPFSFAVYRLASTLTALLEHANIRFPQWLDTALSWVTTWPYAHKLHHSRTRAQTDSNYGNLFSCWDRVFGTFTPSRHGPGVVAGLDDLEHPSQQTTRALLGLPFADAAPRRIRRASW